MLILRRVALSAFIVFLGWHLTLANAHASSEEVSIPVAAEHVFLQALPAGGDGFYAIWNSTGTAGGSSVFAQHFGLNETAKWLSNGIELTGSLNDAGLWDTCTDNQGGLFLASAEKNQLKLRHIDPDGTVLWDQVATSFTNDSPITTVSEIADGGGGAYLAWAFGTTNNSVILVQHWNASGQAQWPLPGVRPARTDTHQFTPIMTRNGVGGVLVAWKMFEMDISSVRTQWITENGQLQWPEPGVGVQRPAGSLRQRIIMSVAGDGGLVSVWTQGVDGKNRLYFQHIDSKGNRSWSGGGVTGVAPTVEQWNPVLLSNEDGNVWIGWEEVADGRDPKVKIIRRGPPKGEGWAPGEIKLADAPGSQGRLALALDGAGGLLTTWIDSRGYSGIYLQHVDTQGQIQFKGGKEIAKGLKHPQYPHLVLAAPDHAAVVWLEEKGKNLWKLQWRVSDLQQP